MKKLLIVLSILFSLNINAQNNSLAGDVNCDSIVNSVDASLILQYVTGILDSLPCQPSAQTIINFMSGSGLGGGCVSFGDPVINIQQNINNLLNEYLKEAQNHLNNLKNHPCHSEMLNLLKFSKIRKK